MKKITAIATITSILVLSISTFVFAAEKNAVPQWFNDMISWKKAQVSENVKQGNLTQEQADALNKQIDNMAKWHSENGFGPGMMSKFKGGFGSRANGGFNCGYGSGMMQGFNAQN